MGIWTQARALADATPATRNRYADFLRAVSILMVITGHWLMTTAYFERSTGNLTPILALDAVPWSAWLTWLFQVMPIFFIVGGYSNGISLASAQRKGLSYAQWLSGRLHRLLTPLTLLVLVWAVGATLLNLAGIDPERIRFLSRAALVPTWFLAIYTVIVLLAPASHRLWQRYGYWSLAGFIGLAVLVDVAFFRPGGQWLGWSNYFWVWLAMHHLGFAWLDGRQGSPARLLAIAAIALAALLALVLWGPYPVAMAGSPDEAVSNSLPPKITLIALGLCQFGLLLAIERPMQRLLALPRLWTATVLVNSMIMTIYLWHMTVLFALIALCYFAGGIGLTFAVGGSDWWASRPLWLLVPALVLVPVSLALSPLERLDAPHDAAAPGAARLVGGAVLCGLGLTLATLRGLDGNLLHLTNTGVIALLLGGAWVCGIRPGRRLSRQSP